MRYMRYIRYFILLITVQIYNGMIGVYSSYKQQIQQEFYFSESFFGLIQMFANIGRIILSIYLVISPCRPKFTYIVCGLIQTASYFLLILSHQCPILSKPIFLFSLTFFGFARASFILPFLMLHQYFDKPQDSRAISIWFGLCNLGHAYGFLFGDIGLTFNLSWYIMIPLYTLIQFSTLYLIYYFIDQIKVSSENQNQFTEIKNIIKQYFKNSRSNIYVLLEFCFQENHIFLILYWFPFFLMKLGLGSNSIYVTLTYPIGIFIASITLIPLLSSFPQKIPIFTTLLILIEAILYFITLFIDLDSSNFRLYLTIFFLSFYCFAFPYTRVSTVEITQRTKNQRQKYLIVMFTRLVRQIITAIFALLVGILIQRNLKNFLFIIISNMITILIVHCLKRIIQKSQRYLKLIQQQNQQLK